MRDCVQRHYHDQKVRLSTAVRELECIIDDLVNDHSNENLPCQLSQPLKTKNGRYLKTSFGCITCNVYTCKSGRCFADYHARVCVRFEGLLNKQLAWAWVSETDKASKPRDDVRSGTIRSLTSAKTEAAKTWKSASGEYDASRATHGIGKIYH